MPNDVIAIDGPSAAGKSTVARALAARLGYLYVDSGSLYRTVTWQALHAGCARDAAALEAMLASTPAEVVAEAGTLSLRLAGADPGPELRSLAVQEHVSDVSAVAAVRRRVSEWLCEARGRGNLVVEGRDIGSVVFPDARHKFYLHADARERARRRHQELAQAGEPAALETVGHALARRDGKDSSRPLAPLKVPAGAVEIDTTRLSVEQVVEEIVRRLNRPAGEQP